VHSEEKVGWKEQRRVTPPSITGGKEKIVITEDGDDVNRSPSPPPLPKVIVPVWTPISRHR